MIPPLLHLFRLLPFLFGGHRQLALENLALRHQLAVYRRTAIGGTKALLTEHSLSMGHGVREALGFILGPYVQSEEYMEHLIDFTRGTDALVTDCTYTDEVYPRKTGWGHSSVS
jgi:hypothetical protein